MGRFVTSLISVEIEQHCRLYDKGTGSLSASVDTSNGIVINDIYS